MENDIKIIRFSRGTVILVEDSLNDGYFYILKSGTIVIQSDFHFYYKTFHKYLAGDTFGLVSGLTKNPSRYTLVAESECEVIRIPIKHLGNYFTDKNGLIEFVLNPDFENKTVKYTESFEGFEEVAGEIRLKNETFHEITIKRLPPIDFWLGLKEKRWLYTKGSIFLLLFVTIFIYILKKKKHPLLLA